MKRYKTLFAVLLTIFSLLFIVFVGLMQQQFNNPEFTELSATKTSESDTADSIENAETDETDSDTVAGAAGSMVSNETEEAEETQAESNQEDNDAAESQTETEETTASVRTVTAETLNARSGPGVDYDITGVLILGQTVEVEDTGDEWVRIQAGEITGYVNEKYLSEE